MPFRITITEDADRQFRSLPVREQRILEAAIQSRLEHQPTTPTKAIKRLRPNSLAEFALRAGDVRALYNVARRRGCNLDRRPQGGQPTGCRK